jgi:CHAT domain-containing protein
VQTRIIPVFMKSVHRILPLFVLALASRVIAAEPADPVGALMARVVGAIARDEVAAFDPLVVPDQSFDWDVDVAPLVARYRCPTIEHWSYATLERGETTARVRLEIDGHAELAGPGRDERLPRRWIASLRRVGDRWHLQSLVTLERDLARRIAAACETDWPALLDGDDEADSRQVLLEIADHVAGSIPPTNLEDTEALARALMRFVLSEARRRGDAALESFTLSCLTSFLRGRGKRAEALSLGEEAVGLAERSGDPDALAVAYFSRGLNRWVNGDNAGAQDDLAAASRLFPVASRVLAPLKSQAMRCPVALGDHNYHLAIQNAEELRSMAARAGWDEGEAFGLYVLGDIHYSLRDFAAARDLYVRVHTIAARQHLIFASDALNDIIRCDLSLGELARAEHEMRASGLATQNTTRTLTLYAQTLLAIDKLPEAEQALKKATTLGEDDTQANSDAYTALAQFYLAQHRPAAALDAAREAIRYGLHEKTPLTEWSAWRAEAAMARAQRALGRTREARDTMETAIAVIEQLRTTMVSDSSAARYFEDKAGLYADLMKANLALGDVRGALGAAERLRARTLRDSLSQIPFDRNATLTVEERARQDTAEKELESANRRILSSDKPSADMRATRDRARQALDRLTDELMTAHPEMRARQAGFRPTLDLPPALQSTAIVEYAVTSGATYAFTIVREGGSTEIHAVRIDVGRRALDRLVARMASQLAQRDLRYRGTAARLYQLLVAPVESAIASRTKLCIIPDGTLWRVPFQVLMDKNGVDLVGKRPLFYAPSITMLTAAPSSRRHTPRRETLVAFANPHSEGAGVTHMRSLFRGSRLGALPDADVEVARIAQIYGKSQAETFVGREARESTFKRVAPLARIVHVASHGVIDDHAPLYSALLFASGGAGDDDGLLEAREVLDLHLDADLVVLSACDTASGKIDAGEGVIGLSWAFLVAGCRTLVVAQSPAESKSTARLMVEFHRQLAGGLSPAEALQRAQLTLRRDPRFAHPFYWAPFVVIGQGLPPR